MPTRGHKDYRCDICIIFIYNVFQLPEGTPPPALCRLARPARWRFETILLRMLHTGYIYIFVKKRGEFDVSSLHREKAK